MREIENIVINGKTLDKILDDHNLWLLGMKNGVKANLYGANLSEANLSEANLSEANLEWANLKGANLKGANLSEANLSEANLEWANLKGANLTWANLEDANLEGANLKGANLSEANLYEANLTWANLEDANLEGANIDFSALPLACRGLNIKIDERIARQLMYHAVSLMQYSGIDTSKILKKNAYKWLAESHVVTEHKLPILKEKE